MSLSSVEFQSFNDANDGCRGARRSGRRENPEAAPIRNFAISLTMLSMFASGSSQACVQPGDQQAFDVIALKSSLMVAALSCDEPDLYNAFIRRFQPNVMAEQNAMDGYYHRAYGLDAQMREDRYVTDLANSQASSTGQTAAVYCSGTEKLFGEVLASRNWDDLVLLTGAKPLPVPAPEAACALAPALPKTKPKEIEAQAASVPVMNQPEVAEATAPALPKRTPEEIEAAEAAGMLVRNQPPVAPEAQATEKRRVETRLAHNDLKSRKALAAKSTKPAATTIL